MSIPFIAVEGPIGVGKTITFQSNRGIAEFPFA